MKLINIDDINVKPDRARREFSPDVIRKMQDSISTGVGLQHPITVHWDEKEKRYDLIAGETRLRAVKLLHTVSFQVRHGGEIVPEGKIPANVVSGALTLTEKLEAELNENTNRAMLTWKEEVDLIGRIAKLQQAIISEKTGEPADAVITKAIEATAELLGEGSPNVAKIKRQLQMDNIIKEGKDTTLIKNLQTSKNMNEANNHLVKAERGLTHKRKAKEQGDKTVKDMVSVLKGNCLELIPKLPPHSIDVVLTDPPYGIDMHKRSDSGRMSHRDKHKYDDSFPTFKKTMIDFMQVCNKVCKPQAHLYIACDIRNYRTLSDIVMQSKGDWYVIGAPFIQDKSKGDGRVPWPGFTPRRSYELWLFAFRGKKPELACIKDMVESTKEEGSIHGAGKSPEFLKNFIKRSCFAGDHVLDPFAGSGSIIPACFDLSVRVTAIEQEEEAYGECLARVEALNV